MNILCLGMSYPTGKPKGKKEILKKPEKNGTLCTGNNYSNDCDLFFRNYESRRKRNNIITVMKEKKRNLATQNSIYNVSILQERRQNKDIFTQKETKRICHRKICTERNAERDSSG